MDEKKDSRFKRIGTDPRFKKVSRKDKKVKLDERFKAILTDKRFSSTSVVDKQGRVVSEDNKEDLKKFYDLSDDEEEKDQIGTKPEEENDDEDEKEDEQSSDDESSDFDTDDEMQEGDDNTVIHGWGELDVDVERKENTSHRLAVCNVDWDKIDAYDLLVLLKSFAPSNGTVRSVKVHLSDFGEKRLQEENKDGPQELIQETEEDNEHAEGSQYNAEKVREYQINRLKYYYAVVECDSKDTANAIYDECDGMEYELSATRMDLRFIPDGMEFDGEPKSVATEDSRVSNYKPSQFTTAALQQTTAKLTWDESDPKRLQTTMQQFNRDDILEMDFKDYLASSESEADCDEKEDDEEKSSKKQAAAEKYKALLSEINDEEKKSDDDAEMEVCFEPELERISQKALSGNKQDTPQTLHEKYLVERQDKRRKARAIKKDPSRNDMDDDNDDVTEDKDLGFEDPFFNQTADEENSNEKGKKRRKGKDSDGVDPETVDEEQQRKKELQLLLSDDRDLSKGHFNMKDIIDRQKGSKKKLNKKKRKALAEKGTDDFEVDVKDDRFAALYSSHHYSLDPSDVNFVNTDGTQQIIKEKLRRREKHANKNSDTNEYGNNETQSKQPSVADLISSVKRRTKEHQISKKKKAKN